MKTNFKHKAFSITSIALFSGSLLAAATSCNTETSSNFFTIKTNDFEVEFCDTGASIYSMKYKDTYITYHPKDKNVFLQKDNYYGKGLGRVAGRIKDGKFTLDGKEYTVEKSEVKHDENNNKENTLHGGRDPFSTKNFTRYVHDLADRYTIAFNYFSEDGECGFPGSVDAWFLYTLYKSSPVMDIDIIGIPSKRTPLNMTTHPYIRLANSGSVQEHYLTIPTDTMATFTVENLDQIVTGSAKVADIKVKDDQGNDKTPFDFSTAKTVGQDIALAKKYDKCSGGYDHIWYSGSTDPITKTNPIVFENKGNGIKMEVTSDANAVIVYANCWPKSGMEMNPKGEDVFCGGITIEPITYFKYNSDGTIDENMVHSPENPFRRHITYKLSKTE